MAEFVGLGLQAVNPAVDHYEKVYYPVKNKTKQGVDKVKKMRSGRRDDGGYESESDYEEYDGPRRRNRADSPGSPPRIPRDRRRSRRGDLVEERYAYYKGPKDRARSVGRDGYDVTRINSKKDRRRDYSDSESSVSPPRRERRKSLGEKALAALGLGGVAGAVAGDKSRRRSRSRDRSPRRHRSYSRDSDYDRRDTRGPPSSRGFDDDRTPRRYKPTKYISNGNDSGSDSDNDRGGRQVARRNNRSEVGSRDAKSKRSSSSSSSSVCSSSEDERRTRKLKGKEYLTAGLAAVATIHAAHSVYQSIEKRDERHQQVLDGQITAEEAKKKKNKARIQDAAAIGIAALGIKGAYSEWKEVQENREEMANLNKEREMNHEKRLRKAQKHGSDRGSDQGRTRNRSVPNMRRRDRS